jgi:NTP pyrophosphatase (non-canonical NTP hydrolase)
MDEQAYIDFCRSIDKENSIQSYMISLCEEVGELAGKIKRIHRDDKDVLTFERREQIFKELGDVLWYWTRMVDVISSTPKQVRQGNYEKLVDRISRGTLHGSGDTR